MWLARSKNGSLYAYTIKPDYESDGFFCIYPKEKISDAELNLMFMKLNPTEFPEITFENSPVEITSTGFLDILDILNNITETLVSDIEQENNNLLSCDNSSDILDKTYNYRLGLIQGYAHAQCLISQMFAKKVSEYLKINEND